jgi:DNA helicase-2/ATP-dependent DNA helicase PcrA
MPSRFLDELPAANVEVKPNSPMAATIAAATASRVSTSRNPSPTPIPPPAGNAPRPTRPTPPATTGATAPASRSTASAMAKAAPKARTIDGELIAKSKIDEPSKFTVGDRVFHIKFGNGNIAGIEGNKLTIDFDRGRAEAGAGWVCGEGVRSGLTGDGSSGRARG